MGIAAPDLC